MKNLPTGTVTFLFTDIEGSTALLQRLGDRRYADVLDEHRRLLRAAFAERGGHEVSKHGDAFLVAFSRARDALETAVAAQRALARHAWPDGAALRVRMGLHTGEAVGDTGDYAGLDVHRASRICSAGHGGQILLSDTVSSLAGRDLPPRVTLRDLGIHRLKDLREPERLLQVMHPDLQADFPLLRSLDARPNNIPIQLTSFIGREREITEVKRSLAASRLVTLTGTGGAGKTRLALHVAGDALTNYPDGVWLVEFAPITDPVLVPKMVASAMSVLEKPGRNMTETLADALRLKSLLLVLDNCEHLLAPCSDLAVTLLQGCPQLRILATSREGLGVPGETLWRVPSLSVPEDTRRHIPPEELVLYDAVRLFADRAAATAQGFTVTRDNAVAVVQVCQRLDGIPLAIELAAARVKVLAVEQIAARLDDRFRLLTGGSRRALPRHQTLLAAMDWSYDLLSEKEQRLLRRLAVFAGRWGLEAAESVCADGSVEAATILDLLTSLVDKSLVLSESQRGEARYRLLETVRHYGWQKLGASEESTTVRDRHFDFFVNFAKKAEPQIEGAEQAVWLDQMEAEQDNFREALTWSVQSVSARGVRLAVALGRFWMVRGHFTEGRRRLKEALHHDVSSPLILRAAALNWAGWMAIRQHDYAEARVFLEQSLTAYRDLGDKSGISDSLSNLGSLSMNQADHSTARAIFKENLVLCRELGDKRRIADTLSDLGHEAWHEGDLAPARRYLEEALTLARELRHTRILLFTLYSLGLVAFDQHMYAEAHSLYEEGLAKAKELGDSYYGTHLVEHYAALIAAEGQHLRAARLIAAADAHRKAKDIPLPVAHRSDYDRPLETIRAAVSPDALAAAWTQGRAMTLEQAIECALAGEGN